MTHEDFGAAPMKADGARIFVVSGDNHARVFKFKNESDLKQTKSIMMNWEKKVQYFIRILMLKINF